MAATAELKISHFDPDSRSAHYLQRYVIPKEARQSVLQALLYIYEEVDPTLAFRFGCRFKRCGLCAMEINGKPRMACLTELEPSMTLEPLKHLPIVRDLVIDRSIFFEKMKSLQLYIPSDDFSAIPQTIFVPKRHQRLVRCAECLICLAECPFYNWTDDSFGGPYLFVKLAMLHSDPRDRHDRVLQARALGIERCRECGECRLYCPMGINIYKDAIEPLLARPRGTRFVSNRGFALPQFEKEE